MEIKEQELKNRVAALLDILKQYTQIIVSDKRDVKRTAYRVVLELMQKVAPMVIEVYQRLDPEDTYGNSVYWANELKRIVEAMEGADVFVQADVLYFEAYESLLSFQKMIEAEDFSLWQKQE